MNAFIAYFAAIAQTIRTSWTGAKLTFRHLKKAIFQPRRAGMSITEKEYFQNTFAIETLRYPKEKLPVPDVGRYKLHNEIDDCIVCDKCAKICPVNCIDIVAIKSPDVIGETSDGTPKRLYAAKFDIDMAKCCYCGLCTTVCPTECLTMTKDYEYGVFDVTQLVFAFANLSPEEAAEKQKLYDQYMAEKEALKKASAKTENTPQTNTIEGENKPVFKPKISAKPAVTSETSEAKNTDTTAKPSTQAKPVFKPKIPPTNVANEAIEKTPSSEKPIQEKTTSPATETTKGIASEKTENVPPPPKPVFKPKIPPLKKDG